MTDNDDQIFDKVAQQFNLTSKQLTEVKRRITSPLNWYENQLVIQKDDGTNVSLNVATHLAKTANPKGVVLCSPGRAETIRQYYDYAERSNNEGFHFYGFDRQGQGGSYTLIDRDRHHMDDYNREVMDFASVARHVQIQHPDLPLFILGHSMGCAISTLSVRNGDIQPAAMVQIAPMYGFYESGINTIYKTLRPLIMAGINKLSDGTNHAAGMGPWSLTDHFERTKLWTDNPIAPAVQAALFMQDPSHQCGGYTWEFGNQALLAVKDLHRRGSPESITTPTLVIGGDMEQINSNRKSIALTNRMPDGHYHEYQGKHQVHRGSPQTEERIKKDVFGFFNKHLPK